MSKPASFVKAPLTSSIFACREFRPRANVVGVDIGDRFGTNGADAASTLATLATAATLVNVGMAVVGIGMVTVGAVGTLTAVGCVLAKDIGAGATGAMGTGVGVLVGVVDRNVCGGITVVCMPVIVGTATGVDAVVITGSGSTVVGKAIDVGALSSHTFVMLGSGGER